MARKKRQPFAYRTLARIEEEAQERARLIAAEIVFEIATNPETPYDKKRRPDREGGPHLRDSYYTRQDPETGDWLVKCRRRYWAFVEFGTRRNNFHDAQPHVVPAIELIRARHKA